MSSKKTRYFLLFIIGLSIVVGFFSYGSLPEQIATHWGAEGYANGYSSKLFGLSLFPVIMAVMFLIYIIIPKIDPLKINIESFFKYYNGFWIVLFLFFAYIFGLTLFWNFGYYFDFTVYIIPAVAVLFYTIGAFIQKSKRNWFIGIRTPWTLSSDNVWDKTHRLGGILFKATAIISLIGPFYRDDVALIYFLVTPAVATAVITVVYSYLEYRKEFDKPRS